MKKYIISFAFIFSYLLASAQVNFQIANANGNKNDTVSVAVTTTGFTNVLGMQYSINYDSNVLAIIDVTKTAAFDVDYSTHVGSATVKNGQITFSWSPPGGNGVNINNGSLLFTLKFKLIGKECDSSFVKLSSKPTPIDVFDGNFNNLTLTANDGKVKINGAGCAGGPPPDTSSFQIIASKDTSPQGIVKCIKITCKGFKNIASGQFSLKWDKAIATFDTLNSGAMVLVPGLNYISTANRDGVGINWDSGPQPIDIPDGTTLFEVCLKPVGAPGSFTDINFISVPILIEFTDGNSNVVTPKFTTGRLTVSAAPAQSLKLYYRDTTVEEGAEFCIPIRADNFKCMQSFQFGVKFDSTRLKFKRVTGINIPAFGPSNIFPFRDTVRFQWDASSGIFPTLKNGDSLFLICFESVSPTCPYDTKLSFVPLPTSPMEFSDCNSNDYAILKDEPSFTVKCKSAVPPVVITLGSANGVKCNGDCNGSILGTKVTGGIGPFKFCWKLVSTAGCLSDSLNARDLCGDIDYYLEVTDLGNGNAITLSSLVHINEPDSIKVYATVTHVQVANDGKIVIDSITGGTPPFMHVWRRLSSGSKVGTTPTIMNLPANMYADSIKDANGCIFVDTFTVNPAPLKFAGFNQVTGIKCHGECTASVFASASGGYSPQTYKWSNGDTGNPADSLCAGNVSVTITDGRGNTVTSTFLVTEPDEIEVNILSVNKASTPTSTDGSIILDTVKGGTPYIKPSSGKYSYEWKKIGGSVISTSKDLTNVGAGNYQICVTDSLLCRKCDTAVITSMGGGSKDTITVTIAIDPYLGGNAVSCRGKCDGRIIATVVSSNPIPKTPYTYKWSNNATTKTVTNLCPGSYTVTVTDAGGNTGVSTTLILPDAPSINLTTKKIQCATDKTALDGQYEAITTGAVPPLSYKWCNGAINKIAIDLPEGNCSVQITDANGCTATEEFRVCLNDGGTADCYSGRLAISPNGDGFNDVFEIACVTDFDNVLTIYDRWGNAVYSAVNYTNDWNGVDKNGETLTEGTYMWVLKVKESGKADTYYKGTVTIVR